MEVDVMQPRDLDARCLRFRLLDLERPRRERLLRVLLRPVGAEDADLLPVLCDRHEPPGFALGALAWDPPGSLPYLRHCSLPPLLGVHCLPRPCARGAGDYASSCSSFWSITAGAQQREPPADALGRDHVGERAQIVAEVQHELLDGVEVRARARCADGERHDVEATRGYWVCDRRGAPLSLPDSCYGDPSRYFFERRVLPGDPAARRPLRSRRLPRRTRVRPAGATTPPGRLHAVRAAAYSSPP